MDEEMNEPRIQEITEAWFIKEPVMMMGLLSHQLKTNGSIKNFRCGKGIIEYNPEYTRFLTKPQLEERLKAEVIRILLRHPYRQYSEKGLAFIASNITLNENYPFNELIYRVTDYWFRERSEYRDYRHQNFEFYYRELKKMTFPTIPDPEQKPEQGEASKQELSQQGEPTEQQSQQISGEAQQEITGDSVDIANGQKREGADVTDKPVNFPDKEEINLPDNEDSIIPDMEEAKKCADLWEEDDYMEQENKGGNRMGANEQAVGNAAG